MCRMYLVTTQSEETDFNVDVFVAANSPSEAAEMAQVHWAKEECPVCEGCDVRVFVVPTPVRMGVIGWDHIGVTSHPWKENT